MQGEEDKVDGVAQGRERELKYSMNLFKTKGLKSPNQIASRRKQLSVNLNQISKEKSSKSKRDFPLRKTQLNNRLNQIPQRKPSWERRRLNESNSSKRRKLGHFGCTPQLINTTQNSYPYSCKLNSCDFAYFWMQNGVIPTLRAFKF